MAVAKVTEITAGSPVSFEAAVQEGISRASKTIDKIQGAWINEQTLKIKDGTIEEYRVNMKVTFVLKGD